jgi:Mg2+ and Co2+ transporter CorA
MNLLSEDITTYKVLSEMLESAAASLVESVERHADIFEPHEKELLETLDLANNLDVLKNKVGDLRTTFEAVEFSMEGLVSLVGTLREEETERLNKVMQFLTVVTTIAVPIGIITGWYGMNFRVMPELQWPGSYFVVIGVALVIIVGLLALFKRKKWF